MFWITGEDSGNISGMMRRTFAQSGVILLVLAASCLAAGSPRGPQPRAAENRAWFIEELRRIRDLAVKEGASETARRLDVLIERHQRRAERTRLRPGRDAGPEARTSPADDTENTNGQLTLGRLAPDFNLPRLTIETDGARSIGKISTETVRLSSFRGKKPVFLIFSSYT
jgi:hypothetical protein